jgi:uncharacterized protein (DUF488 family)
MIYSIGYSRFTFPQVKALMDEKEITLLVDVRSVPYSRRADKYDFNKNRLYKSLGKRYAWKGEILGGKHGPATEAGIDWLEKKHKKSCILLLMCMEDDPLKCHRLTDIGVRLLERGIDVAHILADGLEITTEAFVKGGMNGSNT